MNKAIEEILKEYPFIGDEIRAEQARLNEYIALQQEARNTLKSQNIDGMPHGTDVSDATYAAVEKLVDMYQHEIDACVAKINELLDRKKWLDKAFETLTPEERAVVYLLYDEQYSERRVAKMMYKGSRYKLAKVAEEAKRKIKMFL